MDMEKIIQLTNERIAATQEQAVRDMMRTNAMLVDEVHYLRAIVYGQNPDHPCEGCLRWHSLSRFTCYCEDALTPEPWYSAATDGGEPGCPNYITERMRDPIKPAIKLLLLKFKDGIGHIDYSRAKGYISEDDAHCQKNKLAAIYAGHIAHLVAQEVAE